VCGKVERKCASVSGRVRCGSLGRRGMGVLVLVSVWEGVQ